APANATGTKYTPPSGAPVFATGSNQWDLGLTSIPDIEQITANVLADMSVQPTTPDANITLDGTIGGTAHTVTAKTPADGAIGVSTGTAAPATVSHPRKRLTDNHPDVTI